MPPEQDPDGTSSGDQPTAPQNLEEAQSRLSEALLELGDEALTLEQALDILDLVRIANSLEALEPPEPSAGALPDR